MQRVLKIALATAALGLAAAATPAQAAVTVVGGQSGVPSCSVWSFTPADSSCAGGYEGNLLSGTSLGSAGLADAQLLGYAGTGTYLDLLSGLGGASVLTFNQMLYGQTIIAIHYGAAGAAPEATSFFLFDFGTVGSKTLTINGRAGANALGTSDAAILSTGLAPVPEPATWALMLLGFGGMGMALRRSRRRKTLMQIA
jgi:hypothetical protein